MVAVDISDDYLCWDNVEAVTVNLKSDGSYGSDIDLTYALRMNLDHKSQTFAGIRVQPGQVSWWLPVDEVGTSNTVNSGDKITDASAVIFRVKTAIKVGNGNSYSHWNCLCYQDAA